jgi:hypothetical protein
MLPTRLLDHGTSLVHASKATLRMDAHMNVNVTSLDTCSTICSSSNSDRIKFVIDNGPRLPVRGHFGRPVRSTMGKEVIQMRYRICHSIIKDPEGTACLFLSERAPHSLVTDSTLPPMRIAPALISTDHSRPGRIRV